MIDPVLIRTPVVGKDSLMTREWVRQQSQVQAGSQAAQAIVETVTGNSSTAIENAVEAAVELQNVVAIVNSDDRNPVDFAPAIQDAQNLARETPRVYDDTELRNALAAADVPQNLGFQQQLDALSALVAASDPPLPLANGATGVITIPKLTTANGSITVQNGLIVAFVNPT
jgi:hypothetical protein